MTIVHSIKKILRPSRAIVLMYHRICEPEIDPWQLSVSTENFRQHLEVLSATGKVIGTDELIDRVSNKKLESDFFCITSDDAYEDNYLNALPLIEQYACPATFFVPSGSIGSNEPFWWDMMADIFLSEKKLPAHLNISINNKQFTYSLEDNGAISQQQMQKHAAWHWPETPPTRRWKFI